MDELDNWLEEHYDGEEWIFAPEELSFFVRRFRDGVTYREFQTIAIITPTKYYEDTGYCFDQSITIPGFDWDEISEGTFTPEGDNPTQFLLDLGMTENPSLGDGGI